MHVPKRTVHLLAYGTAGQPDRLSTDNGVPHEAARSDANGRFSFYKLKSKGGFPYADSNG
jgi:hypothetical protein